MLSNKKSFWGSGVLASLGVIVGSFVPAYARWIAATVGFGCIGAFLYEEFAEEKSVRIVFGDCDDHRWWWWRRYRIRAEIGTFHTRLVRIGLRPPESIMFNVVRHPNRKVGSISIPERGDPNVFIDISDARNVFVICHSYIYPYLFKAGGCPPVTSLNDKSIFYRHDAIQIVCRYFAFSQSSSAIDSSKWEGINKWVAGLLSMRIGWLRSEWGMDRVLASLVIHLGEWPHKETSTSFPLWFWDLLRRSMGSIGMNPDRIKDAAIILIERQLINNSDV